MPKWLSKLIRGRRLPINWIWVYVDIRGSNECWPWTGALREGPENYGRFRYQGKARLAHRVSYALCNGLEIEEFEEYGWLVRHTCDNPPCCNPRHLLAGTHAQNMADKKLRCRFNGIRRGEEASKNKLKVRQVLQIRRRLAAGEPSRELAKFYKVTRGAIEMIREGKNWAWLK